MKLKEEQGDLVILENKEEQDRGKSRDTALILKKIKKMNNFLLLNAVIIVVISVLTIYSATIHKTTLFYKREAFWGIIGVFVYRP